MRGSYFEPRVVRHRLDDGSEEFAVHDVYFRSSGRIEGMTIHARSVRCGSVAGLHDWILNQISANVESVVCGDLGYEHTIDDLKWWLQKLCDPVIDFDTDG